MAVCQSPQLGALVFLLARKENTLSFLTQGNNCRCAHMNRTSINHDDGTFSLFPEKSKERRSFVTVPILPSLPGVSVRAQ